MEGSSSSCHDNTCGCHDNACSREGREHEDELNIPWLVDHFSQMTYHTTVVDPYIDRIESQCRSLFRKDYNVELLNNQGGELCGHYPRHIIVPTTYKECSPADVTTDMKELIQKARLARCRSRFPAPVIVYKDKFVCRSATLATTAEILGRSGMEWLQGTWDVEYSSEWETCDKLREADKELLKYLKVKHIFDMMVENKKVKFGVSITSSEKADKEKRYCDFELYSVPYPGTEFFTEFRTKQMCAEKMHFDWEQAFVNAELKLPDSPIVNSIPLNWDEYKDWNLVELTSSYMLLLVKCLGEGEGGLLLHCISGWDRTPLFTALLRLSLWADGAVHQNLNAKEILYLTIAYDWMLFGHQLEDRLGKQEDVFLFCFHFLQYLKQDKYSIRQYQENKVRSESEVFRPCSEYNSSHANSSHDSSSHDSSSHGNSSHGNSSHGDHLTSDSNSNIMRCNSIDSFTDTVCSNATNTSTLNGENGIISKQRSTSPATLMLEERQCCHGNGSERQCCHGNGNERQCCHGNGSERQCCHGNSILEERQAHTHCIRSRQSTGSVASSNGVNGSHGNSCPPIPTSTHGEPSSNHDNTTSNHDNATPSSNGSSYDNTCVTMTTHDNNTCVHDNETHGNHGHDSSEGNESSQNYRGSNSSIDSWLMVSGSLQKDNQLDRIMESKRLQRLDSVYHYFGEAFTYLVNKGTITPTCSSSWSTVIGQLADSVSKVTFGSRVTPRVAMTPRPTCPEVDTTRADSDCFHDNSDCRNTFEMVALNSFNSRSVT